jgi:hypothetical protein
VVGHANGSAVTSGAAGSAGESVAAGVALAHPLRMMAVAIKMLKMDNFVWFILFSPLVLFKYSMVLVSPLLWRSSFAISL